MIEEFMLAANISVADKILKHFPLCSLLRYLPFFNIQFPLTINEINTSQCDITVSFCHLFFFLMRVLM